MVLTGCKTLDTRELVFRPVTLYVLDADTKEPLKGISVTVVNTIFFSKPQYYYFIPIDSNSGRKYHMYKFKTNDEGIVEIPQFAYKVDRYSFVYTQRIVLNIEIKYKPDFINEEAEMYDFLSLDETEEDQMFMRSQSEYKGGEIYCTTYQSDWKQDEESMPYITIIVKRYEVPDEDRKHGPISFYSEHETFVFYLEQFIEP
jgi:hypothetical protein